MGPQLVVGLGRCHNSFSIVSLWLPSTTTPAPTPPRFTMRWSAQKYRTAMYRAKTYCTHEICCTEMYCTALHYTYYTTQMKCIVEKRLSSDAIMAAYCQAGTLCLGWIFIHGNLWKHVFIILGGFSSMGICFCGNMLLSSFRLRKDQHVCSKGQELSAKNYGIITWRDQVLFLC